MVHMKRSGQMEDSSWEQRFYDLQNGMVATQRKCGQSAKVVSSSVDKKQKDPRG